jgi:hypothetical protein
MIYSFLPLNISLTNTIKIMFHYVCYNRSQDDYQFIDECAVKTPIILNKTFDSGFIRKVHN